MKYLSYPKSADTPNRKVRKSLRFKVFTTNKKAKSVQRKSERAARNEENG